MSNGDAILEQELTPAPGAFQGEQFSPSPFHFRFTGEDFLEVASYNSQAGVRIAVQGRMWTADEGIKPFSHSHVPNTDRSRDIEVFGLARGYLLNAIVFASAGTPKIGQTFVSLHVIRGQGQARVLLATLVQGYVTAEQELAFPGSPIASSVEGAPYTRHVTGTDPAAGAFSLETVPTGARWRVRGVTIRLTTSATATTRRPYLALHAPAGNIVAISPQATTIGASNVMDFSWALGLPVSAAISPLQGIAGAPDIIVLPAGLVQINAEYLQAGDNFGAPEFYLDEWLEAQ
jgi:hypothetical protein